MTTIEKFAQFLDIPVESFEKAEVSDHEILIALLGEDDDE